MCMSLLFSVSDALRCTVYAVRIGLSRLTRCYRNYHFTVEPTCYGYSSSLLWLVFAIIPVLSGKSVQCL